jgi:hypothetical protein
MSESSARETTDESGPTSETELMRLSSDARVELTEDFLRGEKEHLSEEDIDGYAIPTGLYADLDWLSDRLNEIINEFDEYDGSMDRKAAPAVHRAVDISRREAADSGIWHDLAIRQFPEFVRHRWKYEGTRAMKKKFWTYGVPLDSVSSTFERLWWIAELTRDSDDYTYTQRAFGNRRLCFRVFDIQLGRCKPAARACIEVLHNEEEDEYEDNSTINHTVQKFRKAASNVTLEGRTEDQLVDIVREIKRDFPAGDD